MSRQVRGRPPNQACVLTDPNPELTQWSMVRRNLPWLIVIEVCCQRHGAYVNVVELGFKSSRQKGLTLGSQLLDTLYDNRLE